jgi:diguanylate cyclase (GGDEF)-like protein
MTSPVVYAPRPANDEERLKALLRYELLDSATERDFDDLTLLASYICQTPIAMVTLIDRERQWFKSKIGVENRESPRDFSFCAHAILQPAMMVVPDAMDDGRFARNPMVTGEPHIRFYAGVPLHSAEEKQALGTLCVIDRVPRELSAEQMRLLEALARQVQLLFEMRLKLLQEKRLSRTDPLTGAANRRSFYEILEAEISRLNRYRRPLSLAYLDLDNFKQMNDRFGHEIGDAVLISVANTVQKHLRLGDSIARMGGDEFAILLKEADAVSAIGAIRRFQKHMLAAMRQSGWDVTFSIGVVTCEDPPASVQQLIARADQLMYEVKRSGKNNIVHAMLTGK